MSFPEHDKLQKISGQSQTIYDFIEWLGGEGIFLAEYDDNWHPSSGCALRSLRPIGDHLASYFRIDTNALEAEKRRMLENQRRMNETTQ